MPLPQAAEVDLEDMARRAMVERGLRPEFDAAALAQASASQKAAPDGSDVQDLRALAWCSIDNEDSRDLDQLTVMQELSGGALRVLVAVADVDAFVSPGTPVDAHAHHNTTSVYTPARVFSMIPERLSTGLTSMNEGEERMAVVIAFEVPADGRPAAIAIFRALVKNQARLTYEEVAAWLQGDAAAPRPGGVPPEIPAQLRAQDQAAHRLRTRRYNEGALDLGTLEARPIVQGGRVVGFERVAKNRARALIEDFMIAANGATGRFLRERAVPTLRRVVRKPERWDRLQALAEERGETLPVDPDAQALSAFLGRQRALDPLRFPDLSLAVVKLMGAGEYTVEASGDEPIGHFGLAVRDYVHVTAPNRRYPDLVTQRLLKATLSERAAPYTAAALLGLAAHCTQQENAAEKVERQVRKAALALLVGDRIGEPFSALVTGTSRKATWIRVLDPPLEGRLVDGEQGLDVGQSVTARLVAVDVEKGHIDFARVSGA